MTAIFYSEIPSHLKINGEYLGVIGKNAKILDFFNDDCLLEFIPQSNEYYSITTSIKNACSIKVFYLFGDIIIIPVYERKRNLPYKLICQKTFNIYNSSLIITVIQDGYYKFYLDGLITYIDELPFLIKDCEIKEVQNILFIIFKGKKQVVFAFDLTLRKLVYKSLADNVEFDGAISVTNYYKTAIPLNIVERWEIPTFSLNKRSANLIKNQYEINPNLIGLSFFQLIALNLDTSFLLAENIKNREKELHGFIGKPIVVFPYCKDFKKTVVILNDSIHLYKLEYENGLINNILEE